MHRWVAIQPALIRTITVDQNHHLGFITLTETETLLKLDSNYNTCSSPQERLRRLHHNVAKETARRKTMLEASGVFSSRSPSKP